MDIQKKVPFRNLDVHARQNLMLFALAVFYLVQTGLMLASSGLSIVTSDYLAYWSIGHIANTQGYAAVYDLDVLYETQTTLMQPEDPTEFVTTPAPLLPVFVILFQVMALLPPSWSFISWTLLNLLALILYLRFFIRSMIPNGMVSRLTVMFFLSFPIFWNFLWGQVNVWLLICIGEFIRALLGEKFFRAGIWVGGLLLKPQVLILFGIVLIIQRAWKVFSGFLSATSVLLGISLAIAGIDGFSNLLGLWIGYAGGIPSNAPEKMVNWRMVGLRLTSISNPFLGWGITALGIVVSLWFVISMWRSPLFSSKPESIVVLLGTLSATMILTWHSHVHMEMMLITPLLYLYAKGFLPEKMVNSWLVIPVASLMIGLILFTLFKPIISNIPISEVSIIFISFSIFVIDVFILFWSWKQSLSTQ